VPGAILQHEPPGGCYPKDTGARADAILKILEPQIDALNGDAYPRPIKLEIANCLSMCGAGPNVVIYPTPVEIYPTPVVFNEVTPEQIETIVREHVQPLMPQVESD